MPQAAMASTGTVVGKAHKHVDKYGNPIATTIAVKLVDLTSGAETKCEVAMPHEFARNFELGDDVEIQLVLKQQRLDLNAVTRKAAEKINAGEMDTPGMTVTASVRPS